MKATAIAQVALKCAAACACAPCGLRFLAAFNLGHALLAKGTHGLAAIISSPLPAGHAVQWLRFILHRSFGALTAQEQMRFEEL